MPSERKHVGVQWNEYLIPLLFGITGGFVFQRWSALPHHSLWSVSSSCSSVLSSVTSATSAPIAPSWPSSLESSSSFRVSGSASAQNAPEMTSWFCGSDLNVSRRVSFCRLDSQVSLWWSAWSCTSPTLTMKCWTGPRVTRPTSAISTAGPSHSRPFPSCLLR